ncbi:MAG: zf-HC2 domain-containing protein [Candidatus Eisenbacteria bacterium]|nr:zf-HC2 domain-containing protein [Candidatus Eisenbacteria bacterium]
MIGCYRFSRWLTAYADGELGERRARSVERHVARCARCARELDSIRASGRILSRVGVPAATPERWNAFRRGLSQALDGVDREARRATRPRELRPPEPAVRRPAFAFAVACAALVIAVAAVGQRGLLSFGRWGGGNECIVDSIETYAAGSTPMFFTSEDPRMTVIWVFSEEPGAGSARQ